MTEKLHFIRQLPTSFDSIGAVIPTSHYTARAMASECARRIGSKTVLEVGAGTGSITAEIVKHLGPHDHLVVCEINPEFVAYLHHRFAHEPAFQRVREQVTIHTGSITELDTNQLFDNIISAIPFNNFAPNIIETILEQYRAMLKPGGVLTYIEYAYLRKIKSRFAPPNIQQKTQAINTVLEPYIRAYQFRRDVVWRNVPPAWIRHLRFTETHPQDALSLQPLEHANRFEINGIAMDTDAIPFILGFSIPGLLVRRSTPRLSNTLLTAAALAGWLLRDPYRQILSDHAEVFAACDGQVSTIERFHDPRLGDEEWLRIAVYLSLFNVHINRAPIAGKVVKITYEPGGYAAAYQRNADHNTTCYTFIEGIHGPCVVAQRVGFVTRRIVNRCTIGSLLAQGERFGLIRFGSRTDVYLPAAQVHPTVAAGDYVEAGKTVIARYS